MAVYRLWVKMQSGWEHVCSVEAPDAERARADAMRMLRPEHKEKETVLQKEVEKPPSGNFPMT